MYPNLENLLTPFAMKKGRIFKIFLLMIFVVGLLLFLLIQSGVTWETDRNIFLIIGAFVVFYLVAFPLVPVLTRRRVKKLLETYSKEQLHRMELECGQREPICGLAITSQALVSEMSIIPISDIVWIQQQNRTIKGAATMNLLTVIDKKKKEHRLLLSTKVGPFRKANKEAMQTIEEMIRKYSPGIYWGISKELTKMYRNNFSEMVAHVEQAYVPCNEGY